MRSLLTLVTLIALATGGVARADTWHKPPAPPAGYDGWLLLYVLPPPVALKWTTPAALMASAIRSYFRGSANVKAEKVRYGHPIGHVHLEMTCTKGDRTETLPLTGQTSDEESPTMAGDALGILFRDYAGRLDDMPGDAGQGGVANAIKDLDLRKQNPGFVGIMRFPITWAECTHLRGYFDSYVKQKAYKHFASQYRARGFVGNTGKHEGSGCAGYGVSFVDVAGLVPRPYMTETWSRQLLIGLSWIGKFFGKPGYPYGSNLIATVGGTLFTWPVKQAIPTRPGLVFAVFPDPWFTALEWFTGQYVPLTLYDPELMYTDLVAQWNKSRQGNNPDWSHDEDGKALVIQRKRPACPPKANLKPYPDKVHDLMKD